MDGVGLCQAVGVPGSLEKQQTLGRWRAREEEQFGVGNKDGEKGVLKSRWDEFVSGGIQVGAGGSTLTPAHSLPSPDISRALVPPSQCGFSSPSPSC